MIIDFEYKEIKHPLTINYSVLISGEVYCCDVIDLSNRNISIDLSNFEFKKPENVKVIFSTANKSIKEHPLIISNIVLDNFYSSISITNAGDDGINNDCNVLHHHAGNLCYTFKFPFIMNVM